MSSAAPPIPARLRRGRSPRPPRKRRRGWPLLAVPVGLLLLPLWQVQGVEVEQCQSLPAATRHSLDELTGTPLLLLNLGWVRRQVENWPGVANVDVSLKLPGKVHIAAESAILSACVAVGRGWHGVTGEGILATTIEQPHEPILEGFELTPAALQQGLGVAERLGRTSGAQVRRVRQVMPGDFVVSLALPGRGEAVVRVGALPTAGEAYWCQHTAAGQVPGHWADLRWDNRLVIADSGEAN